MLAALILLTCVSIIGRQLNGFFHWDLIRSIAPGFSAWALGTGVGPVNGDFEIVESGMAFAIFAFLPFCQITAGHASVDILVNFFPVWVNRILRAVVEVIFAAVLVLIARQLYEGMLSKIGNGETTLLLQYPVWWAYAASFVASVAAAIVGVYMACIRVLEAVTGRIRIWDGTEEAPQ